MVCSTCPSGQCGHHHRQHHHRSGPTEDRIVTVTTMSMRMRKNEHGKEEKRLHYECKKFDDITKEECRSRLHAKSEGLEAKRHWLQQCPEEAILM